MAKISNHASNTRDICHSDSLNLQYSQISLDPWQLTPPLGQEDVKIP